MTRRKNITRLALASLASAAGLAAAQPTSPIYTTQIADCTTADNLVRGGDGARYWFVDPGCDIYQRDLYERPTSQSFRNVRTRYAAPEVYQYLDIAGAKYGLDDRFIYVAIDLFGRAHITSDGSRNVRGMVERYGFRFSTDPDGRFGVMAVADQPELKNAPKTRYGRIGTFAHIDTNGDVGGADLDGPTGLTVTKTDNPNEESGMNGYDQVVISDGRLSGGRTVLWVRISPTDNTVVEMALDYTSLGYTRQDMEELRSLEVEAVKGGPKDPQNYLWNDKYTKQEAGSPNKGVNGLSEFGTQGTQNIYECDTARFILGPEDLNGDGARDERDLTDFFSAYADMRAEADVNRDGSIDQNDVNMMLDSVR